MLTRLDHELILLFYEKGYNQTVIAKKLKISRSRINQILTDYRTLGGKLRKEVEKKLSKQCFFCDQLRQNIHHIDHNNHNNSVDNLMSLCLKHHYEIHRGKRIKKILNLNQRRNEIRRRQPLRCLYCDRMFFTRLGREKLQKYCQPNHRKYDYLRRLA